MTGKIRRPGSSDCNGRRYLCRCQYSQGTGKIREDIAAFPLMAVFTVMIWFYTFMCLPVIPQENKCEKLAVTDFYYIKDSRGYVLFDKTTGESYSLHDRYEANPFWTVCFGAPGYTDITDFLDNADVLYLSAYKGDIAALESDFGKFTEGCFSWWYLYSGEMVYEFVLMFACLVPAWFIGSALVHITGSRSTSRKPLRAAAKILSRPNVMIEY